MTQKIRLFILLILVALLANGCSPRIKLFTDSRDPLKEHVLEGKARGKVLVIPIRGAIRDSEEGLVRKRAGMVQEVVSFLRKAEEDKEVRAVILKVDSPGGPVAASDNIYHELLRFKEKTGAKVVVAMMGLAASGGYYVSLPADSIFAHPTTITGSVGVIFLKPRVIGFMEKMGLAVDVTTSGRNKDMSSPFRVPTEEEQQLILQMIDVMAKRFLDLVQKHRNITPEGLEIVSTARIFPAEEALKLGLIDRIGYLDEAVAEAKKLAGLPEDAKVVVYRRSEYPNDTIYNNHTSIEPGIPQARLLELLEPAALTPGFHYLWPAAVWD
jgi:protease IV